MSLAEQVLAVNNDLPIRTDQPIHNGKVRSVYWLTLSDSERLIRERGYPVAPDAPLAVMVISDRISAFECIWKGEGGMAGVPGKGAALNAVANHWFERFRDQGLADSHILDIPHPLVWIVQNARPATATSTAVNNAYHAATNPKLGQRGSPNHSTSANTPPIARPARSIPTAATPPANAGIASADAPGTRRSNAATNGNDDAAIATPTTNAGSHAAITPSARAATCVPSAPTKTAASPPTISRRACRAPSSAAVT